MKNKQPLVSVVITNYNYGRYIEQAIKSVLKQTYENIELVIIDDGSTDNSSDVINKYQKIARIFHSSKNKGVVYARNQALKVIKGDFFMFLDADDRIPENYVADMVAMMNKGYDVVYGDLEMFGDSTFKTDFPEFNIEKMKLYNIVNASALIKRSSIRSHTYDVKLNRKTHEDYDFFLGLALKGLKFKKANTVLYYRIHPKSRNGNKKQIAENMSDFIEIYGYIISKYHKIYPTELNNQFHKGLLFYFGKLYNSISDRDKIIIELENSIKHLNSQISEKDKLLNSKSFKIGRIITKPFRILKGVVRK